MKLFVSDYDDTYYMNDMDIKENNKLIKKLQKKNFLFAIATGRPGHSIKEKIKMYQIPVDYIICSDGSIIYDKDGNIIQMFPIKQDILPAFINFYQNLNYEEIQFSYPEGYANIPYENKTLLGLNICLSNEVINKKIINAFQKLRNSFPNYNYLLYTHPHFSFLCIKPCNVSKSFAVKTLRDLLDIEEENIYVIGDAGNDYEMIRDFHGVAMSHANPDILKIAKKSYPKVSNYLNEILRKQ